MSLHNRVDRRLLKEKLAQDETKRKTISFYRYVNIPDPAGYRDQLYVEWEKLGCLGRIYLAKEGINAQMSVPEESWGGFEGFLQNDPYLAGVPIKVAVEDDGKSFFKLKIKVRNKIVADGLDDSSFKITA